jgi:predicted DsbA family dithiol-disulfide isomerase
MRLNEKDRLPGERRVSVEYFSDVLCVWAYGGQIRLDELKQNYGDQLEIAHRFLPLFAATGERLHREWAARGGQAAYAAHVQAIASTWSHVALHPRVWREDVPASSMPAHLFLKAVQLLAQRGRLGETEKDATGRFEAAAWRVRCAFFEEARNVAHQRVLDDIARALDLPLDEIEDLIENGEAHAALQLDVEAKERYQVPGSPTLVLNEGRQRLYGNVGYRVIEANVTELLRDPRSGEASWC